MLASSRATSMCQQRVLGGVATSTAAGSVGTSVCTMTSVANAPNAHGKAPELTLADTFFVPDAPAVQPTLAAALAEFMSSADNLVVVTGAGLSTASGIPDYRGPRGSYTHGHKPMTISRFMKSEENRQRYWVRNMCGHTLTTARKPNVGHLALAELEKWFGYPFPIITQNVDGLHNLAGSSNVIELHGSLRDVVCTECHEMTTREELQARMMSENKEIVQIFEDKQRRRQEEDGVMRADGDANLTEDDVDMTTMKVPECLSCGGIVKPHLVFFGENADRALVNRAYAYTEEADAVVAIGTSLEVFSAYRFVKKAHDLSVPVAIINYGPTRADRFANLRSQSTCSEMLYAVVERVTGTGLIL